jgi:Ca2+-binding RTX toxin-like protein
LAVLEGNIMANVALSSVFGGVNLRDLRVMMGGHIVNLSADGGSVRAAYENGLVVIYHGSNLNFSASTPTGGKVTGFDLQLSDGTYQTVASYTGLTGWNFADVDNKLAQLLAATPVRMQDSIGSDVLLGGAKADVFTLGGGAEVMQDWGADEVNAGAGNDRVILMVDNAGAEPGYDRAHLLNMGEGVDTVIIRNIFSGFGVLSLLGTRFGSVETLELRDSAYVLIDSNAFNKNQISPIGTIKTNLATLRIVMGIDNQVTIAGMTIQGTMDMVDFRGNAQNNRITGNAATRDRMEGDAGKDRLQGLGGRDSLYGGDGDDILFGGEGFDRLEGGAGQDLFIFAKTGGQDRIVDFALSGPEADVIDLHKLKAISGFGDLKANHLRQHGDDTWIEANGTIIVLVGIDRDDLRQGDFVF